jgi:hypothetical protein
MTKLTLQSVKAIDSCIAASEQAYMKALGGQQPATDPELTPPISDKRGMGSRAVMKPSFRNYG